MRAHAGANPVSLYNCARPPKACTSAVGYRRLRSRHGAPKALTAMAHCLARIIYQLVSEHRSYDDSIFAALEAEHDQRQHERLQRQATDLGYTLIPAVPI